MTRRDLIALLGSTAVSWPLGVRAQQTERVRLVGVLLPAVAGDPEYEARIAALQQGLAGLGWSVGRGVRIDIRWAADANSTRRHAAELVALGPDVIVASSSLAVAALQSATKSVPIVFGAVVDPVGSGFVASLSHPGGNITGFANFEYSLSGKWLDLCKDVAPSTARAAVLRDAASPAEIGMFAAIQLAAPSLGLGVEPVGMNDPDEIERAIIAFARRPNGSLIVLGSALANIHRDLLITLAARHRLPAVYSDRVFVAAGGLISYGPDRIDQFRRSATYVDRILRGEKPANLPVQAPTKYELVLNLKTAKALGLDVPPTLLARADEVIE